MCRRYYNHLLSSSHEFIGIRFVKPTTTALSSLNHHHGQPPAMAALPALFYLCIYCTDLQGNFDLETTANLLHRVHGHSMKKNLQKLKPLANDGVLHR